MDYSEFLERRIINILCNYPTDSFRNLAKKIDMSTNKFIRIYNSLVDKNIIRKVTAGYTPELLSLTRYHVIIEVSNLNQFHKLQMAFREHPYTCQFNHFFGEHFGCYAIFDIPKKGYNIFKKFLDFLVDSDFCEYYLIYESKGYRCETLEYFFISDMIIRNFDITSFFNRHLDKSDKLSSLPEPLGLDTVTPLQLVLLRDLGRNIRVPQINLIKNYRSFVETPPNVENDDYIPPSFLVYLESFFANRSDDAIKVAFNRQYNFVKTNLIYAPRLSFDRKFYELYVYRSFFIENLSDKKSAQLFNLVKEEDPPLKMTVEVLETGIILNFKLPPFFDSKFNYLIWSFFPDYKMYTLDYFGRSGLYYHFYIDNFSPYSSSWRVDEDWMFNNVVENIKEKLEKHNNSFV